MEYNKKNTKIAGNFASAHGHFDNLGLISADKIETLENRKNIYEIDGMVSHWHLPHILSL